VVGFYCSKQNEIAEKVFLYLVFLIKWEKACYGVFWRCWFQVWTNLSRYWNLVQIFAKSYRYSATPFLTWCGTPLWLHTRVL